MENPVPVIAAELTVTDAVPDEVSVSVNDLVVASVTLPKARVVALSVSCDVVATPVPLSATVEVAPEVALLLMETCPVTAPDVVGAKVTGRVNV
jgi:hypothetical protein